MQRRVKRGQQEATGRPAGGYREASRRLQGGQHRRLQGGQQEATERPVGGYRDASRRR